MGHHTVQIDALESIDHRDSIKRKKHRRNQRGRGRSQAEMEEGECVRVAEVSGGQCR